MPHSDLYSDDGLFIGGKNHNGGTNHHDEKESQRPEFTVKEEGRPSSSDDLYSGDSGAETNDIEGLDRPNRDAPSDSSDMYEDEDGDDSDSGSESDNALFVDPALSGNRNGFRTAPKLPEADVIRMRISQLVQLVRNGGIDLNAEYQRDVVWSNDRKSGLIKSIVEQFYIPPIIFNVKIVKDPESGEKRKVRICVDGKQRLTSVKAFMDGLIGVKDYKGKQWYYQRGRGGRGKNIFSEQERATFSSKKLLCYELKSLSRDQEEDLFSRVQMGVQLNNAEKLRASRGPWQDLADQYEKEFNLVINLSGNKRYSGWFNILACFNQLMEVHVSKPHVPVLKTSPAAIRKTIKHFELTEYWRTQFRRVFTTILNLATKLPDTFEDHKYTRVKTFAPIELITTAALIYYHKDRRALPLLREDILYIRDELRAKHRDLRMNSAVWRDSWTLIDTINQVRGAVDGSTIPQPLRIERAPRTRGQGRQNEEEPTSQASQDEETEQTPLSLQNSPEPEPRRKQFSALTSTPQLNAPGKDMAVRSGRVAGNTAQFVATNTVARAPPVARTPTANMVTGRPKRQRLNLGGANPEIGVKRIKRSPTSD